jgi:hypothetical protein
MAEEVDQLPTFQPHLLIVRDYVVSAGARMLPDNHVLIAKSGKRSNLRTRNGRLGNRKDLTVNAYLKDGIAV